MKTKKKNKLQNGTNYKNGTKKKPNGEKAHQKQLGGFKYG